VPYGQIYQARPRRRCHVNSGPVLPVEKSFTRGHHTLAIISQFQKGQRLDIGFAGESSVLTSHRILPCLKFVRRDSRPYKTGKYGGNTGREGTNLLPPSVQLPRLRLRLGISKPKEKERRQPPTSSCSPPYTLYSYSNSSSVADNSAIPYTTCALLIPPINFEGNLRARCGQ